MSQVIASLVARIGADTTGLTAGLQKTNAALSKTKDEAERSASTMKAAMGITATVVGTTAAIITQSYGAYSGLAEQIRDLALVSGTGAEESSRFIQVLDDYQLTAEDATNASRKLKEQGLSPTIDTLAMLADEYKKIKDPAEQMAFIQDNLGRGGAKWVNILSQESSKLREVAAATSQNLILNDMEIKMYEVGRLAIDEKTDALQGWTVKLGENAGNVIAFATASSRASEILSESAKRDATGAEVYTMTWKEALDQAIAEQLKSADASLIQAQSSRELEQAKIDEAAAMKAVSDVNREQLSMIGSIQSAEDSYQENVKTLAEERKQIEADRALAISQGWWESSDKVKEYDQALLENDAKVLENKEQHAQANREIMLGYLERKLMADGILDDTELNWLLEKGVAWGIYSQEVVDNTRIAMDEANAMIDSIPDVTNKIINVTTMSSGDMINSGVPPSVAAMYGGGRAVGGDVKAGMAYTVGEGGAEMFIPKTDGTIVPNNAGNTDNSAAMIAAIQANKMDEKKLARTIVNALQQVGV